MKPGQRPRSLVRFFTPSRGRRFGGEELAAKEDLLKIENVAADDVEGGRPEKI